MPNYWLIPNPLAGKFSYDENGKPYNKYLDLLEKGVIRDFSDDRCCMFRIKPGDIILIADPVESKIYGYGEVNPDCFIPLLMDNNKLGSTHHRDWKPANYYSVHYTLTHETVKNIPLWPEKIQLPKDIRYYDLETKKREKLINDFHRSEEYSKLSGSERAKKVNELYKKFDDDQQKSPANLIDQLILLRFNDVEVKTHEEYVETNRESNLTSKAADWNKIDGHHKVLKTWNRMVEPYFINMPMNGPPTIRQFNITDDEFNKIVEDTEKIRKRKEREALLAKKKAMEAQMEALKQQMSDLFQDGDTLVIGGEE